LSLTESVERVAAAAKRHGKAWGKTAGSVQELDAARRMGAQMVPWGGDFALAGVLRKCSEDLDGLLLQP
jgi:2-keto-3-deoxy-L-rhamnonate aldolase RhmA